MDDGRIDGWMDGRMAVCVPCINLFWISFLRVKFVVATKGKWPQKTNKDFYIIVSEGQDWIALIFNRL